jgi:hypothetical protein
MKQLSISLLLALIFLIASICFAARPELPRDLAGTKLQGFAPNGNKTTSLTVYKQTVNMSEDIAWRAYTPTACKFRSMSTTTQRGATQTLPANTATNMVVNTTTPFINFTGCTNGELQRQ